ncbi:MAG: hypothetical protein ACP5QO_15790 [Clostridia bacterium]
MTPDPEFIKAAVWRRRRALGLTQSGGEPEVSRSTVSRAENEGTLPTHGPTVAAFARFLRWEPDACERLLRGEEPRELRGGAPAGLSSTELAQLRELALTAHQLLGVLVSRLPE